MGIGCPSTRHCRTVAYPYPSWAALLPGEKARNVLRGGCFLAAHEEFAAATVTASHALGASRARESWESLIFLLPLIPSPLGHQSPLLTMLLLKNLSQLREESEASKNCLSAPQGLWFMETEYLLWQGKSRTELFVLYLDNRTHHWADLAASCLSLIPKMHFSPRSRNYQPQIQCGNSQLPIATGRYKYIYIFLNLAEDWVHCSSYIPWTQLGFTHASSPPHRFTPCKRFLAAPVRASAPPLCSGRFTLSLECCCKGCEKMSLSHGLVTIPCLHPAGAKSCREEKQEPIYLLF